MVKNGAGEVIIFGEDGPERLPLTPEIAREIAQEAMSFAGIKPVTEVSLGTSPAQYLVDEPQAEMI